MERSQLWFGYERDREGADGEHEAISPGANAHFHRHLLGTGLLSEIHI